MSVPNPGRMVAVRPTASYELVLDQVRRAIHFGRFLPGDKLPTERELAEQLAVSRMTVREAMRVLQGEGLVEIRRGRNGGAIVIGQNVSAAEARRHLRAAMSDLQEIADFRLITEPAAARLAAGRRSETDARELKRLAEEMTDVLSEDTSSTAAARFMALDSEFHHRIAATTGNAMLAAAIDDARAKLFIPVGGIFGALHPASNDLHAEVAAAIDDQDADAAETFMRRHIASAYDGLISLAAGRRKAGAKPTS